MLILISIIIFTIYAIFDFIFLTFLGKFYIVVRRPMLDTCDALAMPNMTFRMISDDLQVSMLSTYSEQGKLYARE